MKSYIIALSLCALLAAPVVSAQVPRIRTSAPPSKTAQRESDVPAQTPAASGSSSQSSQPSPAGSHSFSGQMSSSAANSQSGSTRSGARKGGEGIKDRFMAVKTNLAYDAFAVLNVGFEIQVSKKFSVEIPVIWSLWDWKQDMGLRVVAVQPEARYWFGKVGCGSAVGLNLGLASYNFRHDDIRYQNTSGRPLVSAALSYTYVLPIDKHWNAEFSLAVGYVNTRYNRYFNIDNGALINTRDRNYFGPTKVGISLSYRLGK